MSSLTIDDLIAREEIRDTLINYSQGLDQRNWEFYDRVWAPGGTFEGEFYDGYPEGWGIYTYRNPSSSKNCTKESGEWLTVLEENRLKNIYSGLKIGKKWQGFGIGILKSGYCYCGEILNDYRDGYGELYTKKDALERGGIYRKGNIKETLIRG